MREEEVPQDPSFYKGHKRACYAVGEGDSYVLAKSAGWDVERIATEQALLDLEAQVEAARKRAIAGEVAPLAYHLETHQMTPKLCAQHLGIATWRVKRHLKPAVFARMSDSLLQRYAECLDMELTELHRVPDRESHVFLDDDDA